MTIKGKRRGKKGAGRRRPAGAPRPLVASGSRRPPWYRTTVGRAVAAAVALAVVAGIWALVANARSDAARLERRQQALQAYTGKVRGLLQKVLPPVTAMTQVPAAAGDVDAGALAGDAEGWAEDLVALQQDALALAAPAGLEPATSLLSAAIETLRGAAETYALAPKVEGKARADVVARAAFQRERADSTWMVALDLINRELTEADLEPTRMTAPGAAALQAPPVPAPQPTG